MTATEGREQCTKKLARSACLNAVSVICYVLKKLTICLFLN